MAYRSSITRLSDDVNYPILIMRAGSMSVPQEKTSVQEISRPGLNGHDYQQFASKYPMFPINCETDETNEVDALATVRFFESLQGNLVDYQDEYSRWWREAMCLDIACGYEFSPSLGFRWPKYNPLNPFGTSQFVVSVSINLRLTTQPEGV